MPLFGSRQLIAEAVPGRLLLAAETHTEVKYGTAIGHNTDVDAAEDVISMGGDYAGQPVDANGSMLTVAENFELVCAEAADTVDGTGCQQVEITYLDDNGVWSTATVDTDGSAQDLGFSGIRAFRLRGVRFGSGGAADGLITLRHITTTANIFATIAAAATEAKIAALTVPLGFKGMFEQAVIKPARGTAASADASLLCRRQGQNGFIPANVLRSVNTAYDVDPGLVVQPELTDVKLRVTAVSTTDVDIAGQFNYCLIKGV